MTRTVAAALAAWSVGFALVHVAWALGWRAGVPADVAPISERPVFLTYDLVAAVLMVGAAVVACVLAWGPQGPSVRSRLRVAVLVGSVAALLRGVPAVGIDVVTWSGSTVGVLSDLWFTVAGAAGLVLWRLTAGELRRGP